VVDGDRVGSTGCSKDGTTSVFEEFDVKPSSEAEKGTKTFGSSIGQKLLSYIDCGELVLHDH